MSCMMLFNCVSPITIYAKDSKLDISGILYEFGSKDHYEFSSVSETTATTPGNTYGTFALSGDLAATGSKNGVNSYSVTSGTNVSFYYEYNDSMLSASDDQWHLVDDKSKKVNDISFDENIMKGAVILQISKDGEKWIDVSKSVNVFNDIPIQKKSFYETTNVQLINGCYYRVIVAYETSIKRGSSKILFINKDNYEYKKTAEVYEFFIYDKDNYSTTDTSELSKFSLGKVTKTADEGYAGSKEIEIDDAQYGWSIGDFFVSGYTSNSKDDEGNPIFLKNVGDQVTLWFNLTEDIDKLNNKDNLSISSDKDAYDQYFETKKTDSGRGTLIVRRTDYENVTSDPNIYTNYLEANLSPGADTKVQLCEEGDYEVALDYEIKNDKRIVFGKSILPEYTHYRIFFKFSVRNGNCMVYAFDSVTGSELSNGSITPNGFKLDLANSRYLDINIKKEVLEESAEGLKEDVRFNRPAKDGEEYTDEGVYTFTVSNKYTNQETIKKIYIGDNKILKAYMASGLTIQEIYDKIANGVTIEEDGTIVEPSSDEIAEKTEDVIEVSTTDVSVEESDTEEPAEVPIKSTNNYINSIDLGIVGMVIIVVVVLIVFGTKKKKFKKSKKGKAEYDVKGDE